MSWNAKEPVILESEGATMRLRNPAPGVVHSEVVGVAPLHQVDALLAFDASVIGQHPDGLWILHDWSQMEGYEPGGRKKLVEWNRAHKADVHRVEILFRSRLVGMGVSVATLLVPELRAITDRKEFDRRLASVVEKRIQ